MLLRCWTSGRMREKYPLLIICCLAEFWSLLFGRVLMLKSKVGGWERNGDLDAHSGTLLPPLNCPPHTKEGLQTFSPKKTHWVSGRKNRAHVIVGKYFLSQEKSRNTYERQCVFKWISPLFTAQTSPCLFAHLGQLGVSFWTLITQTVDQQCARFALHPLHRGHHHHHHHRG